MANSAYQPGSGPDVLPKEFREHQPSPGFKKLPKELRARVYFFLGLGTKVHQLTVSASKGQLRKGFDAIHQINCRHHFRCDLDGNSVKTYDINKTEDEDHMLANVDIESLMALGTAYPSIIEEIRDLLYHHSVLSLSLSHHMMYSRSHRTRMLQLCSSNAFKTVTITTDCASTRCSFRTCCWFWPVLQLLRRCSERIASTETLVIVLPTLTTHLRPVDFTFWRWIYPSAQTLAINFAHDFAKVLSRLPNLKRLMVGARDCGFKEFLRGDNESPLDRGHVSAVLMTLLREWIEGSAKSRSGVYVVDKPLLV